MSAAMSYGSPSVATWQKAAQDSQAASERRRRAVAQARARRHRVVHDGLTVVGLTIGFFVLLAVFAVLAPVP